MSKTIGNVNILDLRQATEESVAEICRARNVSLVLYSMPRPSLLAQLDIGNPNAAVEMPEFEPQIRTGQVVISRGQAEPTFFVIVG